MLRVFLVLISCIVFSTSAFAKKDHTKTDDPNHYGYFTSGFGSTKSYYPVDWIPYETKCERCKPLAASYNKAMQNLMYARYMHEKIERSESVEDYFYDKRKAERHYEKQSEAEKNKKNAEDGWNAGKALSESQERSVALAATWRFELAEAIKEQEDLKPLIKTLESTTADLRRQIETCEKQCTPEGESGKPVGALGHPVTGQQISLPFDWKGPYDKVCEDCKKLAQRLNDLPALALKNLTDLDAATTRRKALKAELQLDIAGSTYLAAADNLHALNKKYKKKLIEKMEDIRKEIKALDEEIKVHEGDYKKIKKNFEDTLAAYNECIKTCKKKEVAQAPVGDCSFPTEHTTTAITVGPNDQFGSSAAFQDKLEGQAKGAALGALNSVLGGSGISLGGGGKGKKPKIDKDPTKGKMEYGETNGVELGFKSSFTGEDELVTSFKIDDAPGDGTFHIQWIEDINGKIYLPTRYLLLSLYQDWKLTVWWTYDRWVNGEHVEDREGEEVTFGTTHIADFLYRYEGAENIESSIWHSMGFNSAKKGVQKLGTVYNIPQSVFDMGCPLRVVNHITLPDEDPVITQPITSYILPPEQKDDEDAFIGTLRTTFTF